MCRCARSPLDSRLDHQTGHARRATTHTDLQLRAVEKGIPVRVVHNASVMNAIGACGLQLYRYGEVRELRPARAAVSLLCVSTLVST